MEYLYNTSVELIIFPRSAFKNSSWNDLAMQGVDFTSVHLYPDYWATGNLTFQLDFTAQFLTGHIAESSRLNKPLIIGEFGK